MKILQLCKKFPWPLKDGESLAVNAISKGLAARGVSMDLLAMNTTRHFTTVNSEVIRSLSHYKKIHWVPVDTDLKKHKALQSLMEGSSYHLKRFRDAGFAEAIRQMILSADEPYDFIFLESLYMTPYIELIRETTSARIVLRSHNLEWEIWDRLGNNSGNPIWRWYLKHLASKLKNYEEERIQSVDYLLPISEVDRRKYDKMGYRGSIMTLPMGIDPAGYPVRRIRSHSTFDLSFIGSLDWRPNLEGLHWFMKKVWPRVRNEFDGVFRIHIAGRNMPRKIRELASKDVIIHGEVEDAVAFMQEFNFSLVPLFSGSGMRVKILEAMAMGKIVLSTGIGIEGIPATAGKEFIEANDIEDFMKIFENIYSGNYSLDILSMNARSFIEDNYGLDLISENLHEFLTGILRDKVEHFTDSRKPM